MFICYVLSRHEQCGIAGINSETHKNQKTRFSQPHSGRARIQYALVNSEYGVGREAHNKKHSVARVLLAACRLVLLLLGSQSRSRAAGGTLPAKYRRPDGGAAQLFARTIKFRPRPPSDMISSST